MTEICTCEICDRRRTIQAMRAKAVHSPEDITALFDLIDSLENQLEWATTQIDLLNYERQKEVGDRNDTRSIID